ncbi:ArsR/SmtB family transcription factor [Roseibium salinum]|uniref:Helix-turn-helix domain-containing protein n=1 Tax=Roseibium salinum TaxID=1604349 RepID=A0ABT3R531_9HYPH|nr:helix-turn-helix domain-containing protein [Roseibium sp. DSM 29163]MCX2724288.1 helix-turn-helix domain-containing protein [Roseibium sp. DSM 29163]
MDDEQLDRVFKALADPTRRRIIDRLRERPDQSLFQICVLSASEDGKALSRQAITQHLYMLEKAGLVHVSWSGRTKLHSLDLAPLHEAMDIWLGNHVSQGKRP